MVNFKEAILVILVLNFLFQLDCKKSWSNKSMRRLTKQEAELKVYVFPCSINLEEEKFLNTTAGSNKNHLRNCKRKLVIKMTVNSGGEVGPVFSSLGWSGRLSSKLTCIKVGWINLLFCSCG